MDYKTLSLFNAVLLEVHPEESRQIYKTSFLILEEFSWKVDFKAKLTLLENFFWKIYIFKVVF